ncbi:hypothetical protein GRI38_12865 [Altererythrobacter aurantiacus]|uniref:Uncharacterized protein n=1 Tax=Parapontixanthobacter aurantiacus TaxID=1463599 RepID=A0A844ZIV3_9SPHN|nr:hypothetical protein [Parapontixanthobacter aurantiacus]
MDTLRGQFDNDDLLGNLPEGLATELEEEGFGVDGEIAEAPPSPVGQDERRMQVRAYNHWAELLGDQNFPAIEDLDPASLEDFGPYSVLLDFTSGIESPGIQFLGARLAEECGADTAIKNLDDVPSLSLLSRITDHYMQILANQAPIGFEAEFVNQRNVTVMYRGILLPYSSDDETIDFIYGVINWKEVADDRTADELLLEIDQALAVDDANEDDADDGILDLALVGVMTGDDTPAEEALAQDETALPEPAFGVVEEQDETEDAVEFDEDDLGYEDDEEEDNDDAIFLQPDFGDDDVDEEGEEIIVDDSALPSLMGISIGKTETKVAIDLSDYSPGKQDSFPFRDEDDLFAQDEPVEAAIDSDTAYTSETSDHDGGFAPFVEFGEDEDEAPLAFDDEQPADQAVDETEPATPRELSIPAIADKFEDTAPEGLHECLAVAREFAYTARNSEDRSRAALYEAVGRAYDVSIEAANAPEDFAELLEDNGMSAQDRAPMTPVVKLVFGADYDKTRLTEYATVLAHAHRVGVERGKLGGFLSETRGGLKEVVRTERKLRREEKGETVAERIEPRPAIANKLRALPETSLEDLPIDGAEFALVMVRRTEEGELVVLGEVPQDIPMIEKAAKKLIG